MVTSYKKREDSGGRFNVRELTIAMTCAVFIGFLAFNGAMAAEKPLIEKWLDGEIKANYPKVTYDGAPITLKYSDFLAPNHVMAQLRNRTFDRLEQDTNGKLMVRRFWGNTLSNAQRGAFEAISAGVADFGACYVTFNPGGFTLHLGLQVPFIFQDVKESSYASIEAYPKYLKEEYESKGVYLGCLHTTPPQQLLTRDKPIQTLGDLKGKKIFTSAGLGSEFGKALGAVPTIIQVSELYTAYQRGVVDVVPFHDAGAVAFRFAELSKYRTVANSWTNATEFAVNKAAFDKLPADLKQVFYHWYQLSSQAQIELYYDLEAQKGRVTMEKMGIKSIPLPPQEVSKWRAAVKPVVDEWISSNEAKGLPAKAFVADLEAMALKYRDKNFEEITRALLEKPIPGIIKF